MFWKWNIHLVLFLLVIYYLFYYIPAPYSEFDQTLPGQSDFGVERERRVRTGSSGRVFRVAALERVPSSHSGLSASSWLVTTHLQVLVFFFFFFNFSERPVLIWNFWANTVFKFNMWKKAFHSQNKQPRARRHCLWWPVGQSSLKGTSSVSSTRTFS